MRSKNEIRDMVENELVELSKFMDVSGSLNKLYKLDEAAGAR